MRALRRTPRRGRRRDPAPSRLAYRLERLRLSPGFRHLIFSGLVIAFIGAVVAAFATNEGARRHVALGIADMRQAILERPEFTVNLMAIDGASAELAQDIREALPYDFPTSSFHLDLEEMREVILALDPVAEADMRIRPGGILQVDVRERLPALVWRGPQGVETLDREGRRVGSLVARAVRPDLPLITGAGADRAVPEALELFRIATPVAGRVRGLVRMGERRWDMVLDRGQRILLPEREPAQALQRVLALDRTEALLAREVTTVDMRLGHRPTLRLAAPAVAELWRARGYPAEDSGQ